MMMGDVDSWHHTGMDLIIMLRYCALEDIHTFCFLASVLLDIELNDSFDSELPTRALDPEAKNRERFVEQ
jgi:hypothetical protein